MLRMRSFTARTFVCAASLCAALVHREALGQSAIDQVNDAFRTPALGVGGRSSSGTRASASGLSPLDALDSTQHLSGADGPSTEHVSVHPTIAALRGALWYWLDESERRRLSSVDAARTNNADTPTLQLFLADRALRRFAPMALAVRSRRAEALALRALPPLRTLADANAAARVSVVQRIIRRREAVEVATVASFARRLQRLGASIVTTLPTDEDREFAADRAVIAATEAARTRDAAEVAIAIAETGIAYGGRAERSVVVDEAIHLLEELVAVARGTPAVERPLPPLPVRIDPDANDLPTGVLPSQSSTPSARAQHRTARGRAPRTAGSTEPALVRRSGPDARCYDDLRCFQDER
jgi:hypothetical protein